MGLGSEVGVGLLSGLLLSLWTPRFVSALACTFLRFSSHGWLLVPQDSSFLFSPFFSLSSSAVSQACLPLSS